MLGTSVKLISVFYEREGTLFFATDHSIDGLNEPDPHLRHIFPMLHTLLSPKSRRQKVFWQDITEHG